MTEWQRQLEAIGTALILIERLPAGATWALECTNEDGVESPSVLNVFAPADQWIALARTLKLVNEVDAGPSFLSYRRGALLVSLIEWEEKK